MLKRYSLSSVAAFAPPGEGDGPDGDDRIPEPTLDDDETPGDPVDEEDEADDVDDDQGSDDGADDEQDGQLPDESAAVRPARGDRQMGALRAENRRLAEEQARLTRQLDEVRRGIQQPPPAVETPAQRAERLALLSPDERAQVVIDEALARHSQQQAVLTNQLMDQSDRASFDTLAAGNPLLKKLAPEVERRRAELIQRDGQYIPRGVIATYIIGERVLAQNGKGRPAAQQRRRQQQGRPANGAGDIRNNRRERQQGSDTAADLERRFGDVPI